MTVILEEAIRQRIWRGYDDPGLPVGMYVGHASLAGDGSGGEQRILFIFKDEGEAVSGRFFNLEQMAVHRVGDTTTVDGALATTNFDRSGNTPITQMEWVYTLTANSRAGVQAATFSLLPDFPIYLGQLSLDVDDASLLIVEMDNIDSTTLFATIQGYIWESRSTQAPGGLRRPADSLFG